MNVNRFTRIPEGSFVDSSPLSKAQERAREEFDERFNVIEPGIIPFSEQYSADTHKSFIDSIIARTREELISEIEEKMPGKRTTKVGSGLTRSQEYLDGGNEFRNQVIYLLKSLREGA